MRAGLYKKYTPVFFVLFFLLTQCGQQKASDDETTVSESASIVTAGNVTEFESNDTSMSATLSDVSDDEDVLVVLYGYNTSSTTSVFELTDESTSSEYLTQSSAANFEDVEEAGANDNLSNDTDDDEDITETFHDMLRNDELQLDGAEDAVVTHATSSRYSSYSIQARTVGSTKSFNVLNSYSSSTSFDTVTATLRYATDKFEFYVDNRNASAITDADLEELADGFKVDEEHALFGEESDVDGDGKFAVLFTQTVNSLGASGGGLVTGFFYATDLFDSSVYANSNEMEVYYTVVPDASGSFGTAVSHSFAMSNIFPSVLPHEFQHMISFNQHYFLNGGSSEESWLNEGISHLAEDIGSIDDTGYMVQISIENPSRVAQYLADTQNICFTCGSSLKQRGGSYLFLRYVYEQAQRGNISNLTDGADLIAQLLDTKSTGVTNLTQAIYGGSASTSDLKFIYGKFSLAVALSDTAGSDNDQLQFFGINLHSVQDDNRGTVLSGPSVQSVSSLPYADSLTGNAITYLKISGEMIQNNGGKLEIATGTDEKIMGYIVR